MKTTVSQFQFINFIIRKSEFQINEISEDFDFIMDITPRGFYNKKDSTFNMSLEIEVKDKDDKFYCLVEAQGLFEIKEPETVTASVMDNYFYISAPTIIFPYIRAYISSLTALSGISAINLPPLNLTTIKDEFKKNTEINE